jgi:catechol 2,3-dioxygenase-like lactoylglutathione lyase family enzyme
MKPTLAPARLLGIEPQLFVTDMGRALHFWTERLGFAAAFTAGEPPYYAQVVRDGIGINLRHVDALPDDKAFRRAEPDALAFSITVDDVAALETEFATSGATFHQRLRKEDWGASTFILQEPDGALILFSGG